jgi:hypothetical protein
MEVTALAIASRLADWALEASEPLVLLILGGLLILLSFLRVRSTRVRKPVSQTAAATSPLSKTQPALAAHGQ